MNTNSDVAMTVLFDVIATTIARPHRRRILAFGKPKETAEAIVRMAVCRRGVAEEFFQAVPAGSVQEGGELSSDQAEVAE